MKIELVGTEILEAKLKALPYIFRTSAINKAIEKSNKLLVSAVQQRAPVETGILKKSIISIIRTYRKGKFAVGVVGPDKDYGGYVIMKKDSQKSFKKAQKGASGGKGYRKPVKYAHLMEGGTGKRETKDGKNRGRVTPRPFMQPSLDSLKQQIQTIFETEVDEALNNL
ncbi:MAG: HK97 gp10 family phage protein [Planctomycetaceae bacterium]|jgi:HK97 gp10 family phage protein|nr:HK97 gp10 family phage protein [Planctomycetaceae bacterium]